MHRKIGIPAECAVIPGVGAKINSVVMIAASGLTLGAHQRVVRLLLDGLVLSASRESANQCANHKQDENLSGFLSFTIRFSIELFHRCVL